ncbi:MAG: M20/M25/M40 family metallo-hydrolase, partial [Anaerolineaceae bacterium]|nr:M20/M25/M40 family metallo-hydrolase [Anaerolineaceae bacterium]
IYAAAKVDRTKVYGNILVSATVHEEVFEGGSLKTVVDQTHPDYVVIGEATDFNINHGGRGRAEIIVETIGQSAHSSSPEIGNCAVHEMIRLIHTIESHQIKNHPVLGPASMVLTDIISSPFPGHSVIPNRCRVTFDRRLLLGETIVSLEGELEEYAQQANTECKFSILDAIETTYTNFKFEGKKFFPAWLLSENHLFVQKSLKAVKSIAPESQLSAFRFCTNGAFSAGIAGIATIGFGLGKETDAHTVNESIEIKDLIKASECYQSIIEEVLQ